MSTEDRMNRWAAELISLPKEAVQASVDYQEFTSSLPSAVLVLNAMVKDEYNVSLDITDGQATVVFTDDDGETMTIRVNGLEDAINELKKLSDKDIKTITNAATSKAASLVAQTARSYAPVGKTHNLRDAITFWKAKRTQHVVIKFQVGFPWATQKYMLARAPHWHLIEFGHDIVARGKEGKSNKGGKPLGRVASKPFLRPAFYDTEGRQVEIFRDIIRRGIRRVNRRIARKGA